ncbi:MAG TPA: non-homologous end-joining DNA ligase [Chthoniobacteraceae bacterium]|nr:non-homologous end-joining DNA ligase [Chthoniobacteraceae bacterium]
MSLQDYAKKRDFSRTGEPKGRVARSKGALRFVIQKHDASRLHYDFRLELDGTLKSWAVPKGVPFSRGEKRLAVEVEDHPLDYADFEGVIPQGQYGGGTVMVWDKGTYEPLSDDPAKELTGGKLHFLLHGTKLNGEWALVRMRTDEGNQWLLFKAGENVKALSKKQDDQSVLTGRTMAAIAREQTAEWQSNRAAAPAARELPFVEPMKAKLAAAPPTAGKWIYELKFDGFRALALKSGESVRLLSRNNRDLGDRFPEIIEAIRTVSADSAILDGEIVALDPEGRSSFQLLQAVDIDPSRPPIAYYAFDLLQVEGADLLNKPLSTRKAQLKKLLESSEGPLRYSAEIEGDPGALLKAVQERGLEGIIGKRADSKYEPGLRSGAWIKLKCVTEQEFVIGGSTPPQGTRQHFGALLVGYHEGGALRFAGKVGTGFNAALLKKVQQQLTKLEQAKCPFANLPEKQGGRWSQNITPAEMKRCRWVQPELVCQVKFTEWTRDGKLRHPVFLGLREDKAARKVVREIPT